MTHELKFRYVYGVEGQPETYYFRYYTIEEIENGYVYAELTSEDLEEGFEIISRDQFIYHNDSEDREIFENDYLDFDEKEWGGTFGPELVPRISEFTYGWPIAGVASDVKSFRKIIGNIYGVK